MICVCLLLVRWLRIGRRLSKQDINLANPTAMDMPPSLWSQIVACTPHRNRDWLTHVSEESRRAVLGLSPLSEVDVLGRHWWLRREATIGTKGSGNDLSLELRERSSGSAQACSPQFTSIAHAVELCSSSRLPVNQVIISLASSTAAPQAASALQSFARNVGLINALRVVKWVGCPLTILLGLRWMLPLSTTLVSMELTAAQGLNAVACELGGDKQSSGSTPTVWRVLTTLAVEQTDITDNSLACALQAMPVLETLRVGGCAKLSSMQRSLMALQGAAVSAMNDGVAPLRHLSLANTPMTSAGLCNLPTYLPLLATLNCHNCIQLTDLHCVVNGMEHLESLTLATTGLFPSPQFMAPAVSTCVLSALNGMLALTSLDLRSNTHLSDISGLNDTDAPERIHCLNISSTAIHSNGLGLVLSRCVGLKELHVARCKSLHSISDAIDSSWRLQMSLLTLNAAQCGLTSAGVASIATLRNLRNLDLSGCTEIAAGVLLSIVSNCCRLRQLSLHGCDGVSDSVLEAIATCLAALENLNVGRCDNLSSIASMVAPNIAACNQTLRVWYLVGSAHVTAEGVEGLDRSFPLLAAFDARDCPLIEASDWAAHTALGSRVSKFHI